MKKIFSLALISLFALILSACQREDIYKVGASPVPHAEILEYVKPLLKEEGYEFEIVIFTDYVLPNVALDSNDIIANFFQHTPYLNLQIEEHDYDFVNVGGVHVEPIGLYTKEYDSLDALPDTLELIISNSPSDRPRLLGLLEEADLITLNETTTEEQIVNSSINDLPTLFSSSKTITFNEVDPTQLFTNYDNLSGDAVLINGNYALDNGLNPLEDALVLEGSASLYVNILVAASENADDPFILKLIEVLQSEQVQNWIREEYNGSVVPAA
ncbi:MAG: MetQ/NlpA family ABC transporter substrate-binding protein [Candidatus Izemoplasmataceae bacterium]